LELFVPCPAISPATSATAPATIAVVRAALETLAAVRLALRFTLSMLRPALATTWVTRRFAGLRAAEELRRFELVVRVLFLRAMSSSLLLRFHGYPSSRAFKHKARSSIARLQR
jgi:hypothetical protein